jgi:hypothetical protein
LFSHKHVKENPQEFVDFFGPDGTLLYYPIGLVVVRGFSATFNSSQNWTYDYQNRFSAEAGGGFNIGFINFGGSSSYSKEDKEHQVHQQNTNLTISDDPDTLRFVGYVVVKNNTTTHAFDDQIARIHFSSK